MKTRLCSEAWYDVADLCEQGAIQAEEASDGTHADAARLKAMEWMNALCVKAHKKGLAAEKRESKKL
jgi:hypothetical protein